MSPRAAASGAAVALGAAAALAVGALAAGPERASGGPLAGASRAPVIRQLVVFKSGKALVGRTSTRGVHVRVGGRRCAVATGTPLAGLVRSKPGRIRLRDFGSCGSRARDAGGLFVTAIRRDRNRGQRGWVYKVGRRAGTAGAADPSGPFGNGRLRSGRRVVWFYCVRATDCQRTLVVRARVESDGTVTATVVGYDDAGDGVRIAGATARLGSLTAVTDADGHASLAPPPGSYRLFAKKAGLVRSFPVRVKVP
jgi:hypothetical protein